MKVNHAATGDQQTGRYGARLATNPEILSSVARQDYKCLSTQFLKNV